MTVLRKIIHLNWIAAVIFPVTVILTEVMWVYPWLIRVGSWPLFTQQHTPLSLASVTLLLGGAFFVTKFFIRQRWTLRWTRLSLTTCGLAAILIVLRIEYSAGQGLLDGQWFIYIARFLIDSFSHPNQIMVALMVGLYLWWRGIGLGHSPLFFDNIYRSFSFGLIAQVVLIMSGGAGPQNSLMTGLYVAGFFFFSLSALALAKLKGTQQQGKERGGSAVFNGRWLSIIVVVIAGIILVGAGIASIFSTQFLSVLGQLFNLVTGLLFKVLYYPLTVVVTIIGFVIAISFYILQAILNMLQGEQPTEPLSSSNLTPIEGLKQGVSQSLSPETMLLMKWVLFTLVIAAMVFLIARSILHHQLSQTKDDVEETHESIWSWEGFLTDLRLFCSLMWQRFRGNIKAVIPETSLWQRRHRGPDAAGRLSVREIYQHLLWQAAQLGITRRYQETPYEYSKRLGQAVPEGSTPLNELTDLYVNVRYGDLDAEVRQVDYANSLWKVIRKLLAGDKPDHAE